MKVKISTLMLILLTTFCNITWANNGGNSGISGASPTTEADICAMVSNVETWLEGQVLGGNTLVSYFNASQPEFIDFANTNGINTLKIDFYWQSNSGNSIQLITSSTIDNIYTGFNVESWAVNIENADTQTGFYATRVTINDTECGELIELPLITEEIEEEEEELPVELPEFECGDEYVNENITNQDPLVSASSGETFIIGGFPVLLETVSGSNGQFSGTAVVPLPFKRKVVKVDFNNISVNTDREVYQGELVARAGDPASYPDFTMNPDTLSIGGDICLPPPPPPTAEIDDWGFDPETGIHSVTGTQYDENGFDVNGNHYQTGGPYNEQGCNREGVTEEGEACDPGGGDNPEAEAFADQIAPTIGDDLSGIIQELKTALQDSLNILDCATIRSDMEGLMSTLGYNRDFVFGENDRFFDIGMHREFDEEPQSLVLNIERNQDAKELESQHVDLYHCDKATFAVNALLDALQRMEQGAEFDELKSLVLDAIRNWSQYEYGLYHDDPGAFREWLIRQVGIVMIEKSGLDDTYVDAQPKPQSQEGMQEHMRSIFDFNQNTPHYNTTAALDNGLLFDEQFTLEDASFYFRQGHQSINGIDRAFYLEGIARQQTLTGEGDNLLPIKVEKTIGNRTYTIYLDGIVFTPGGAALDAYIIIADPESGRRLVFKALDIGFGPTGMDVESRLELATDIEIRLNNAAMLILKGTEDTYVAWDCDGFSSMGIDAEIEFCRNFIIPLDPQTMEPKPETERYRLAIAVQDISTWLEFYMTVDAPPFTLAHYQDVSWELNQMVLDFSSTSTPPFQPLDGYDSPYWDGTTMAPLWKGFYMNQLTATLPDEFSTSSEPIEVEAFDVLIDGAGFSGGVGVSNLIPQEEGSLGGWPFSIDEFQLRILKNQLAGAGLAGTINVPVFEEYMDYEAVIYPGSQYKFTITPSEEVTMDLFLATGEISEDSQIKVSYDQEAGEFLAEATLNGIVDVTPGNRTGIDIEFSMPDLCFQGLKVSNKAPYLRSGTWGLASDHENNGNGNNNGLSAGLEFAGFGIRLSNIAPYDTETSNDTEAGEAGLAFNLGVELNGSLDIAAEGGFGLEGELVDNNGRQKWQFKRLKMRSFTIDASFPGVKKLYGALEWYDATTPGLDPKWGKGFRGYLDVDFKAVDIRLQAAAQFGRVDDYKYFFVDALAEFGAIGSATGLIKFEGFGGGVSMNMLPDFSGVNVTNEPSGLLPPIGQSISGATYTPTNDVGLGLRATVVLSTIKDKIFNGTVSLSVLFNGGDNGGGLHSISLQGSGQFLKSLDVGILPDFVEKEFAEHAPTSVDATLAAYINLMYNFNEPSFHGEFNVFLNAGPFKGAGEGGKMVDAEVHFDPGKWYIYIGRPEEGRRCGIEYSIPGIGGADITAYLDVGTDVPPMSPLPQKVREIAYKVNTNSTLRNSGAGFVMGASIGFEISASVAGIVSASLEAEAGFDGMIREFSGFTCEGGDGLDGFYFMGQLWAYIEGELKVFGVNVVSAGIAAVLQMRIPKFWVKGTVGVRIKLLFATIKKSVKLEFGEACFPDGEIPDPGLGMDVIALMNPFDDLKEVETNVFPTAILALELDKDFPVSVGDDTYKYKARYSNSSLTYGENNIPIAHSWEAGEGKTSIVIKPYEMLPENEEITFELTVRITKDGQFYADETKTTTFTTRDRLDYIPESNIAHSYPLNGMLNYYKEEYNAQKGHIQLITGMSNLLINIPEGHHQRIRLTRTNGQEMYFDYEYDPATNKIVYPLPSFFLIPGELYKVQIVRLENTEPTSVAFPVYSAPSNIPLGLATGASNGGPQNDVGPNSNIGPQNDEQRSTSEPSPEGNNLEEPGHEMEDAIYTLYFRVSEYVTFRNKIDDIKANGSQDRLIALGDIEGFGGFERVGDERYDPLIEFSVNLSNPWMNQDVKPVLEAYEDYFCLDGAELDYDYFKDASKIVGQPGNRLVTRNDFLAGSMDVSHNQSFTFFLDFRVMASRLDLHAAALECMSDVLEEMQMNCGFGNNSGSGSCQEYDNLQSLLQQQIPPIRPGAYSVTVKYRPPGLATSTTTRTITFDKE